jgi:hypothetical protein
MKDEMVLVHPQPQAYILTMALKTRDPLSASGITREVVSFKTKTEDCPKDCPNKGLSEEGYKVNATKNASAEV